MAKVRVSKTSADAVKPNSGPGDKLLNDEQIEQWSQFAQKNQNLNFDQKWDAFSKINPKFGASKDDVRNALFKHNRLITEMENKRVERGYEYAPRTGGVSTYKSGTYNTGDIFLPLFKDGKQIGRYDENMQLSSLYPKQPNEENARIVKMMKYGSKIPPASDVDLKSKLYDISSGIVRYFTKDEKEFAADINELMKIPEYAQDLQNEFGSKVRSQTALPGENRQIIQKLNKPSIFNK